MRLRILTTAMPLLAMVAAPLHAVEPPMLTGVYSSITRTPSEDFVGMEIVLSLTDRGYFATLQCAGGADATRPLVVPVQVSEDRTTLRFAAHDYPDNECPMEAFTGKRTSSGLKLSFPSGYDPGPLKRGSSFWNRMR